MLTQIMHHLDFTCILRIEDAILLKGVRLCNSYTDYTSPRFHLHIEDAICSRECDYATANCAYN